MPPEMSQLTRREVLAKLQHRYERAGVEYKSRLITQAVELFGYHRKAAIRALRRRPRVGPAAPYVIGRPREYGLAALQPCGKSSTTGPSCGMRMSRGTGASRRGMSKRKAPARRRP